MPRCQRRAIALTAVGVLALLLALSEFFGVTLSLGTRTRGCNASLVNATIHLDSWGIGPMHRGWALSCQRAAAYHGYRRWWFEFRPQIGIPLWPLGIPLAAWLARAWRTPRNDGPRCAACGYSFLGLATPTCPECGAATHPPHPG